MSLSHTKQAIPTVVLIDCWHGTVWAKRGHEEGVKREKNDCSRRIQTFARCVGQTLTYQMLKNLADPAFPAL